MPLRRPRASRRSFGACAAHSPPWCRAVTKYSCPHPRAPAASRGPSPSRCPSGPSTGRRAGMPMRAPGGFRHPAKGGPMGASAPIAGRSGGEVSRRLTSPRGREGLPRCGTVPTQIPLGRQRTSAFSGRRHCPNTRFIPWARHNRHQRSREAKALRTCDPDPARCLHRRRPKLLHLNGCSDQLHAGHVARWETESSLGHALRVRLTTHPTPDRRL